MVSKKILKELRHIPEIAYYFRYPLHDKDFREIRRAGRLVGRFASKGLYGKLDQRGRVDRRGGLNGQVATIFLPARARTAKSARVIITRTRKEKLVRPDGSKNWENIRREGERAVVSKFGKGTIFW